MGSTLVLLVARGSQAVCLWAGDSRLYRLRDGSLSLLSHDHSYVQDLVDSGALTERVLTRGDLARASTIWFINSLRGWVEVSRQ